MGAIAIRIITDSTCDLSPEDQACLNVQVVPLTVQFAGVSYLDGMDLTCEQFYDMLDRCEDLPTTSQISSQTFADVFRTYLGAGDEIVGIFISGEISGTYQSACMAKNSLSSDCVHIVDSRSATMSLALLVSEAAKLRDAGFSAAQIAEHVRELAKKVRFLAVVNTLKYLRKGGRISAATAVIGEMLGVKPIVSMIGGKVQSVGKARGVAAALEQVLQNIMGDFPDLRYGVVFAHSSAPELLGKAIERLKAPLQITDWLTCNIGSVIGTYAGRGCVGLAYIAKEGP